MGILTKNMAIGHLSNQSISIGKVNTNTIKKHEA